MNSKVYFLMIARLLYDKGYREYVEAAKIVKKEFPDVRFALLGPMDFSSPMRVPKEIVEQDIAHGYIEYLGVTDNVVPYMKPENVVAVLPSFYYEGLNRFLMEACALSCPIITTDIPGCREVVDEGKNGFLVPPKDYQALAMAMIKMLNMNEKQVLEMSKYSRIKAEKEFDINIVIGYYKEIVKELMSLSTI